MGCSIGSNQLLVDLLIKLPSPCMQLFFLLFQNQWTRVCYYLIMKFLPLEPPLSKDSEAGLCILIIVWNLEVCKTPAIVYLVGGFAVFQLFSDPPAIEVLA